MQSRFIALAVLALLAPVAWGQATKAEPAEAETDAAMERAKRAAAGPLRAIQQAAKIRRRADAEAVPSAALVAASAAAAPTGAADRALTAAPAAPTDVLLEFGALVPAVAEVAPLGTVALMPAGIGAPPPALGAVPSFLDVLPAQPRVVEMVEPTIPPALLAQGPRGAEVEAELSLRADGSVADVRLLPPVPAPWQRYIVAALERWRFEPMSGPRSHRVRLVFSAADGR